MVLGVSSGIHGKHFSLSDTVDELSGSADSDVAGVDERSRPCIRPANRTVASPPSTAANSETPPGGERHVSCETAMSYGPARSAVWTRPEPGCVRPSSLDIARRRQAR
jgi:hypothetical protein